MIAVASLSEVLERSSREPEAIAFSHSAMTHLRTWSWLSDWVGSSSPSRMRSTMYGRFHVRAIIMWMYARITRASSTHCLV